MSQKQQILDYLKTKRPLTPLQALKKFGTLRLGARIYELKRDGHRIQSCMIEVGEGKHVASYLLLHTKKAA